jgi:cytochrome P450
MASLTRAFPRWLARKLDPGLALFLAWQDSVKEAVQPIVEYRDDGGEKMPRTIFHTLRDSDLPPPERSLQRLSEEGEIFTGAGSETTAKALTTILYHLTTNPDCMQHLKHELRTVMPDARSLASWTQFEQLPYLSAVIQEGLRLSRGITTRLPRIASEELCYHGWTIPPGTPVSQTPYFVLMDPNIFPEPACFRPDRWLQDGKRLARFQVSFNKGSRQCIGIK